MKKNETESFGKIIPKEQQSSNLKSKVKEFLSKLNDLSTQEFAFKQFKILLNKYNSQNDIKIVFPLLLSYSNSITKSGREFQIILISYSLFILKSVISSFFIHKINW